MIFVMKQAKPKSKQFNKIWCRSSTLSWKEIGLFGIWYWRWKNRWHDETQFIKKRTWTLIMKTRHYELQK